MLEKELTKDYWIIEGNFSRTFEKRLAYADFCIYLDYPQDLCLQSVNERIEKFKGQTRPDMPYGCKEKFDSEFIEWIKDYHDTKRPTMLANLKNSGVPYKIFTSREETALWLQIYGNLI